VLSEHGFEARPPDLVFGGVSEEKVARPANAKVSYLGLKIFYY
jgi:hypothetical protein